MEWLAQRAAIAAVHLTSDAPVMNMTERIRDSLRKFADLVFRTAEFSALGSETSVTRALKELCGVGVLVRLACATLLNDLIF